MATLDLSVALTGPISARRAWCPGAV